MSNPQQQQNQPKQPQQQPPQEKKFEPTPRTIFLIQTDPQFDANAREYLMSKYGGGSIDPDSGEQRSLRILTEVDGNKLTESAVILVLYQNPDAPIKDETTGKWRRRDPGLKSQGKWTREPEQPKVLEVGPFEAKGYWIEGIENDGGVDTSALVRDINAAIAKANRGQPASARIADRGEKKLISIRAV